MKVAIVKTSSNTKNKAWPVWVEYCEKKGIEYRIVNPYDTDVISEVKDCDVFMWHHSQTNYRDLLFANQLLFSLQQAGKTVYPDFNSNWHFDDKVGQKYLLESIDAPLVKSYVFYDKEKALEWAEQTSYPKVFKLRCGAAGSNVKLVHSYQECKGLIQQAFGKGFPPFDAMNYQKEAIRKYKEHKVGFKTLLGSVTKFVNPPKEYAYIKDEKGYAYFQDFMPNNTYDTRVIVIHGKYACAERRMTRKGDFRASGSGEFSFDGVDTNIVKIAFEVAQKLKMQSVAFDFVYDADLRPKIVEICFGFGNKGISQSQGYWTNDMEWHPCEKVPFYEWIIEGVLSNNHF